jgi:TPR repeat protein
MLFPISHHLHKDSMRACTLTIIAVTTLLFSAASANAAAEKACDPELGKKYQLSQDFQRAVACYEDAIAKGVPEAALLLGSMRLDGLGVPQDTAKARELFMKAAAAGVAPAMYNLGVMYERGTLGKPDMAAAARYYRQAADLGMMTAKSNLALMYLNGAGVARDYEEAERLLIPPADAGLVQAQFNLGILYVNGYKDRRYLAQAPLWLERAALNGHRAAPQLMGALYADGHGVKADLKAAYTWFLLSEMAGNPDAKAAIADVRNRLSQAEQADALKARDAFHVRQKAHYQEQTALVKPVAEIPVRSRCVVAVRKSGLPGKDGDDGRAHFARLISLANEKISTALIGKMSDYRLSILDIAAPDLGRSVELMNRAMENNDCGFGLELTHDYGKTSDGGYLQFRLAVSKRPFTAGATGEVVHSKVYRVSMDEAFKDMDFRKVADTFFKDVEASKVLGSVVR